MSSESPSTDLSWSMFLCCRFFNVPYHFTLLLHSHIYPFLAVKLFTELYDDGVHVTSSAGFSPGNKHKTARCSCVNRKLTPTQNHLAVAAVKVLTELIKTSKGNCYE
jgi:hypothetical protein